LPIDFSILQIEQDTDIVFMTSKPSERIAQAEALYTAGQLAFERGNYRTAVTAFEEGSRLAGGATLLGGSIQIWLMNAYSAAGRQPDAIALGEKLAQHPDRDVRKQSKRVLEILKAPQLNRRADWLTPVPDLSELEESGDREFTLSKYNPPKKGVTTVTPPPEPEDLSSMNTRDNGFLIVAIALILATLGGLFWWGG
jgi:tetratricopeptide (TPR) repeat protein